MAEQVLVTVDRDLGDYLGSRYFGGEADGLRVAFRESGMRAMRFARKLESGPFAAYQWEMLCEDERVIEAKLRDDRERQANHRLTMLRLRALTRGVSVDQVIAELETSDGKGAA